MNRNASRVDIVRAATLQNAPVVRPKGRVLQQRPAQERKILGLGSPITQADIARARSATNPKEGFGAWVDMIAQEVQCPVWNMQTIEQVRWDMLGPVTEETIGQSFSASIDLFGSGKDVPGIDFVETTMAQPGQTQTYMITCYVGVHLFADPLCFTAQGNAWARPLTSVAQPPSPDVFTVNDVANGTLGTGVSTGEGGSAQIFIPAVMEHGWWANYALWMMVLGYNLRWKIGQHTNIMDDELRNTAYMPSSAEMDSASSSQVDIVDFVNRMNGRYDQMGSSSIFLKINRLRIGSVGTGATNFGIFKPDRSLEVVDATYGGIGLRSAILGNKEYRKLTVPYVIKAGVPIGLFFQETDSIQAGLMRRYLSISEGDFGTIPPLITDDSNVSASEADGTGVGGGSSPVALERTLDGLNQAQQVYAERALFKSGETKIALKIMGFEVTESWYDALKNNPDLADMVQQNCGGCCIASQGA